MGESIWPKTIDAQVATFNDAILNTFCNSVPNKSINIDDKWNLKIKNESETRAVQKHIQNGRFDSDFISLENSIIELNNLMSSTKASYYKSLGKKQPIIANKNLLVNPKNIFKWYWNSSNSTSFGR